MRNQNAAVIAAVAAGESFVVTRNGTHDWDDPEVAAGLPEEAAVSMITLAELAPGPHLTADVADRAQRQARLQQAESLFDPLDFDRAVARSYGVVVAAVVAAGCSHRARVADLLIAAVAHANGLALCTRNPADFTGLDNLVAVIAI